MNESILIILALPFIALQIVTFIFLILNSRRKKQEEKKEMKEKMDHCIDVTERTLKLIQDLMEL